MEPERFDSSTLTPEDLQLLADISNRRTLMDRYIRQCGLQLFTCPCCGFPTMHDKGAFEYCDLCDWRDDGQDDPEADDILQGSNGDLSLTEHRLDFGYFMQELAQELEGTLVSDPKETLAILEHHKERMDVFQEMHSMNVDDDDPVWEAWQEEKSKVRLDMIKKR